jgi:hypothetical protein
MDYGDATPTLTWDTSLSEAEEEYEKGKKKGAGKSKLFPILIY